MTKKQEKFDILSKLLIQENQKYNLTRIIDPNQIKVRHFEDSLVVIDMLKEYEKTVENQPKLIDIGSGAGFPGLALAIELENWQIVSVESTGKKAKFQEFAAEKLKLDNFTVLSRRAEELAHERSHRSKYDVVTARALGHLVMISELACGFLKTGGVFFAWKGPKVEDEIQQTEQKSKKTGLDLVGQFQYKLGSGEDSLDDCRIVRMVKISPTVKEYPRPFGVIKKSLA